MRFSADLDAPLVDPHYAPRTALPIPGVPIESEPSVNMKINVQWFSHIIGIMNALDQPDAWQGDESTIEDARAEIRKLIASVETETPTMTMPLGLVIPFAGKVAEIPSWLLLCDGTTYDRIDYPDLYSVLEDAFIIDADHFQTPNLNENFVRGGTPVGDTGGEATVTLTTAEIPSHTHFRNSYELAEYVASPITPPLVPLNRVDIPTSPTGFYLFGWTLTGATGGGGSHNNLPPYMNLRYYIVAVQV